MAESLDLECIICMEKFTDPSMLPCGHTFCLKCIKACVESAFCQQIRCPECRERHQIPDGGVSEFPKNYTLIRILSGSGKMAEGTEHKACRIHNKTLESYCEQCKEIICKSCCKSHKNHRLVGLEEKVEQVKKTFEKVFIDVDSSCNNLINMQEAIIEMKKMAMKNKNETKNLLKDSERKIINKIQKYFNEMHRKVCTKLENIESKCKEIESKFQRDLNKRMELVAKTKKAMNEISNNEILTHQDQMLANLKREIQISVTLPEATQFSVIPPKLEVDLEELCGKLIERKAVMDPAKGENNNQDQHLTSKKLSLIRKINTRTSEDTGVPYLGDIQVLSDGTVIVIDGYNHKIKTYSESGDFLTQFIDSPGSNPLFLSPMNADDLVLVSSISHGWFGKKAQVTKWNVKTKVHYPMRISVSAPHGITLTNYQDQTVGAVAEDKENKIKLFDINDGRELGDFSTEPGAVWITGHPKVNCIAVHDFIKLIYYKDGKKQWVTNQKQLIHPHGMEMRSDGSVIIADIDSNKIFVISQEGAVKNTLLSAEDGLNAPLGVSICEKSNLLVITEESKPDFKVYSCLNF